MTSARRRSAPVSFPLLSILLALAFVGCRTLPPEAVVRGQPLPLDDARASRVFVTYLEATANRNALRGMAQVSLTGPDLKLNRPQNVVIERPARLRFEVIGLFDQLAAVVVSDGEHYGFYDASTGEMERGPLTPTILWDLARVDVAVGEAVGLLLGAPRPPVGSARAAVWLEADDRVGLAFVPAAEPRSAGCGEPVERGWTDPACFRGPESLRDGADAFVFDRDGRLAEVRAFDADGSLRYRAGFEAYRRLGEGPDASEFPNLVTIESAAARSEARFAWKRVMLAGALSDRLFRLPDRSPDRTPAERGSEGAGAGSWD